MKCKTSQANLETSNGKEAITKPHKIAFFLKPIKFYENGKSLSENGRGKKASKPGTFRTQCKVYPERESIMPVSM